jgi:hypothetical protein
LELEDSAGPYLHLKPSVLRVALVQLLLLLAAFAVLVLYTRTWRDIGIWYPVVMAIGMVYSTARAVVERLLGLDEVVVDDGMVGGYSGAFNGGVSFPVSSVEPERSGRKTIWRRLSGTVVIQSRGEERIELFAPYYRPDELDELLRLVGVGSGA